MSSPSMLKKLGDKASSYVAGLKTLPPEDSEVESLRYNQEQVDALSGKPHMPSMVQEQMTVPQSQPTDATRYGSREGEKRYMVDPKGNLTEIPMQHPQHVDHYNMSVPYPQDEKPGMPPIVPQSLKAPMSTAPVYDDGGDVSLKQMQDADAALSAGASRDAKPVPAAAPIPQYTGGAAQKKSPAKVDQVDRGLNVLQPSYAPGQGPAPDAPAMPTMAMPTSMEVPVHDEGGDVDVNDGKHSVAVVEDGERVLTPTENDQFKKEHPQEAAAHAQPTQSTELRPFAEVKAEKDKAQNPQAGMPPIDKSAEGAQGAQGAQPAPPPAPEQKPTASHEERVAIKTDQQNAMGKGINGLTQLGMANIHAKQLGLKGMTEDAEPGSVTSGMTAPAGLNGGPGGPQEQAAPSAPGMPQIPTGPAAAAPPNTSSEQSGDFKTRLKQLELDHAKALAQRTPEGKVQADYIQEQINDLHKNNPWGTSGNHPGILGKLGHVAAKVGNIAGDIAIPSIMANIPGTAFNQKLQERGLQTQTAQDEASLAAQDKADKTAATSADWKLNANVLGPNGRPVLENSKTGETKEAPVGYKNFEKPVHASDKAAYIEQWYKDHKDAEKSVANDDKALLEYGEATSAAAQENKAKGKVYYYDTDDGRHAYTYAEAKEAGLDPNDSGMQVSATQAEKDRKAGDTYNSLNSQLEQYRTRIEHSAGQLLPSDVENMSAMIEHTESPDYVSKIVSGVVDDFYGKPVTGYNEKLMKGSLTKKAYDNMSPAARQLVADYFTTMMAHFANVKAVLGQVPRNATVIQSEMNMIPKPYLNAKESEPAFNDYKEWSAGQNIHNVKFGKQPAAAPAAQPNEHQQFIQSINLPGGGHPADAAKGPNNETIIWSGKAGDPWTDLVTGKPVK